MLCRYYFVVLPTLILFKNKSSGKKFISPVKFYKNGILKFLKTGNYLAPSGLFELQTQQMAPGTFEMFLLGDQNFKINKTLEISLQVKGGSQLTSFIKTKNPDFNVRVLYSRRDLNPHAQKSTGF